SHLIDIRALELLMGLAGAGSAVALVSVLASANLGAPLAYIGRHSLYIFLAFFLPMAVMRVGLVRLGVENGDVVTLLTTAFAVVMPIVAYRIVVNTPLDVFFVRPDMFRLTSPRPHKPQIMVAAGD
ncbi:MAG: hypothetical protein WD034_08210, partial [Parvibaculum sp.]